MLNIYENSLLCICFKYYFKNNNILHFIRLLLIILLINYFYIF